jgi:hypothetical protein
MKSSRLLALTLFTVACAQPAEPQKDEGVAEMNVAAVKDEPAREVVARHPATETDAKPDEELVRKVAALEAELTKARAEVETLKQTPAGLMTQLAAIKMDSKEGVDEAEVLSKQIVDRFPTSEEAKAANAIHSKINAMRAQMHKEEELASRNEDYAEIVENSATPGSKAEVERVQKLVEDFRKNHPTDPRIRTLKKIETQLTKALIRIEQEKVNATAIALSRDIGSAIGQAADGTEFDADAIRTTIRKLRDADFRYDEMQAMPRTTVAEARKDPEASRGKLISGSVRVLQIYKEEGFYRGTLCADSWCNKVLYFITPGSTNGIVENSRVKFAGTFVQRYWYENSGGGSTESLLLVGYFQGQA